MNLVPTGSPHLASVGPAGLWAEADVAVGLLSVALPRGICPSWASRQPWAGGLQLLSSLSTWPFLGPWLSVGPLPPPLSLSSISEAGSCWLACVMLDAAMGRSQCSSFAVGTDWVYSFIFQDVPTLCSRWVDEPQALVIAVAHITLMALRAGWY